MKILVLGSKGQLGRCLFDQLTTEKLDVTYASRSEVDITDIARTNKSIKSLNPAIVINASAYTAVDKAEDDEKEAEKINHHAVANIAKVCCEINSWLIHISTDYVFDGESNHPYCEESETNPQGIYGKSKLNGEKAVQLSGCKYIILRTAWVYSEYGSNFLTNMLKLGVHKDEIGIVSDQIGSPTYAQDIAKSIVSIVSRLNIDESLSGIFHYCGDKSYSWYDFALAIFSEAEACGFKIPSSIMPITTADYPTAAIRPAYSVLDCSKIENCFGITRSNFRDGIKIAINKINI